MTESALLSLYLDEDCQRRTLTIALDHAGFDVLTSAMAHRDGASDFAQLEFAASKNRVLVTLNIADFCRLHAEFVSQNRSHSGIVLIPQQRYTVGEQARRLKVLARTLSGSKMQNRLEFLSGWEPAL